MKKQDEIREKIVNQAMLLFNTKGIAQTSVQDIMAATGLPKGAIYRRFKTKELIVLAAFEQAGQILQQFFAQAEREGTCTLDKLMKIAAIYQDAVDNPPIPGGCPLLNTAVESDGTFPELRQKAAEAYGGMVRFIQAIIEQGVRNKEFRTDIDAAEMASFLIESMEGAIMASRLTGSNDPIKRNMKYTEILLRSYMNE
ncbi:TetR/AcrR family transcriptional regulator [Lihuaxuella thermophila]|uniref:DNA-binding transcriptional regulator, AcrR family n=1 Tax=Lihuaxuella thermophila TaxID=1173111 RepID=A0A1H8ESJ1_9BACL|nr:TetR/AcrR family transcriptional regulator [Lihuaxuella thermophila]SEN22104.1 DNA-binding transcriptional regulator, AcrR family [Lihuaxuella thermophila]